jgi:hypothetical protein
MPLPISSRCTQLLPAEKVKLITEMIKYKKLAKLIILFFLLTSTADGQNISEKQFIDSIVSINSKTLFLQKEYAGDSLKATYFINPQSGIVMKIMAEPLDKFRKTGFTGIILTVICNP